MASMQLFTAKPFNHAIFQLHFLPASDRKFCSSSLSFGVSGCSLLLPLAGIPLGSVLLFLYLSGYKMASCRSSILQQEVSFFRVLSIKCGRRCLSLSACCGIVPYAGVFAAYDSRPLKSSYPKVFCTRSLPLWSRIAIEGRAMPLNVLVFTIE